MARSRNIKPGFFQNEDLAELGAETMILFAGLWTIADSEGRLEYRPKRIKVQCVPYFTQINIAKKLESLASLFFIQIYGSDSGRYIQITNWDKHQGPLLC